jgi:hypothetical protein
MYKKIVFCKVIFVILFSPLRHPEI